MRNGKANTPKVVQQTVNTLIEINSKACQSKRSNNLFILKKTLAKNLRAKS